MNPGEPTTGTRDEHYSLISVLYHALHGAETIEAYLLDAEAVGDERLAGFFREARAAQMGMAERAKELLGIGEAAPEMGGATSPAPGNVPNRPEGELPPVTAVPGEDVAPPEEAVPPDVPSPPDEERP